MSSQNTFYVLIAPNRVGICMRLAMECYKSKPNSFSTEKYEKSTRKSYTACSRDSIVLAMLYLSLAGCRLSGGHFGGPFTVDERTWYTQFQTRIGFVFFFVACAIYSHEIRFDFQGRSVGRGKMTMICFGLPNDEKTVTMRVTCEY